MKKTVSVLLIILCLFSFNVFCEENIKVFYNLKKVQSDVDPYIENSRTLIPIIMLTSMGYSTEWNEKERSVTVTDGKKIIVLSVGSKNATVNGNIVKMDTEAKITNNRTYVPIRFISENFGYNVLWKDETKSVYISDSKSAVTITNIFTTHTDGKLNIKIEADSIIENVNRSTLESPLRYVFDISNAVFATKPGEIQVGSDTVSKVRYSQYSTSPSVVRVVIDANKKTNVSYEYKDGIFTISAVDTTIASIDNLEVEESQFGVNFKIDTNRALDYTTYKLSAPTRYYIEFEKADINIPPCYYTSSIVDKVAIEETDTAVKLVFYLVGASYKTKCDFAIVEGSYYLSISKTNAVSNSNKLIVIDPGHGGEEPGSLGKINGKIVLYEKDANLKIAMVAYNKLLADGYNVIATRTDDSTVSLQRRVEIANESEASIFVSVHNNSFDDSSAMGTLTMYAYSELKPDAPFTDKKLASVIQPYILAATKSQNRNLMENPKIYVLHNTNMPSCLVECLFISNPDDLAKLMNDNYVNEMGVAIANGIEKAVMMLD